jgi:hypothetical protein
VALRSGRRQSFPATGLRRSYGIAEQVSGYRLAIVQVFVPALSVRINGNRNLPITEAYARLNAEQGQSCTLKGPHLRARVGFHASAAVNLSLVLQQSAPQISELQPFTRSAHYLCRDSGAVLTEHLGSDRIHRLLMVV